jgi:UrcA family protein
MKRSVSKITVTATATLAVAAAVVLAAPSALAANNDNVFKATVRYGDIDLSSGQGAAHLYSRLQDAVRFVCGDTAGNPIHIEDWQIFHACEQEALERAVEQIDRPALTAEYDRHFSKPKSADVRRAAETSPRAATASIGG